ncbi:SET domain-containing protein [Durusdinium trenchii]
MLLYYNKSFFWLLLERRGSVFFRLDSVFGGLFIAALGGVVQYMRDSGWEYAPQIHHHYAFQALGAGVTFAIVFRTQLAWNRYWEAVTQLHFMYSKWADAFSQFQAFAEVTRKNVQEKDPVKADRIRLKQWRLKINYALLSTVAADRLTTGDNQRMEEVQVKGVRTRNTMRVDKEAQDFGLPKMAVRKEFDRMDSKTDAYVVFEKPSAEQVQLMMASNDIVSTVMYWILWDLADCMKDIEIAPPIQSRMYQELSNGMLGFNNCLKIADVPFPLPFAQLLGLLLVAFSAFIPVYVINFTGSPIAGPILCFFLFESLWCLNEVAKELENPFGQDTNDISLTDFHMRFVDCLEDVTVDEQVGMLRNPFLGIDPGEDDPEKHGIEVLPDVVVPGMEI